MPKHPEFPQKIFAKIDQPSREEEPILLAYDAIEAFEDGETIAVYERVSVHRIAVTREMSTPIK